MGVRQRYRALRGTLRAAADVIARAVRPADWTAIVSTYGEPNTERLLPAFEQYALHGYGGNGPVFSVIDTRRRLFSEARFKWRRLSDKKLFGDAGLALLERPWPNGATGDLLARMEIDVCLAGNAYIRNAGDRLERLRPDWVTIVSWVRDGISPGQQTADGRAVREVVGYLYEPVGDPDRQVEFYPEDEVAHWAPVLDPLANWRGMSWLTPVLAEINADRAMTEHRDTFFRNAATPNLILKYAKKLAPVNRKDIAAAIAARHAGPEHAGSTLVLDEGADPMIVGAKFSDAQFQELQAAGENRIAVAAGVPAIVVGLKEGLASAAWSMYRQAMRAFADLTMRPNWRSVCAALSKVVEVPAGAELWFDTSDIAALQEGEQESAATLQTQAATASTLISAGYTPQSVVTALSAGDLTLLEHTGLYSVQLRPPGSNGGELTEPAPLDPAADGKPPQDGAPAQDRAEHSDGQPDPDAMRAALWWLLRGWDPALHPRDHRGRFRKLASTDLRDVDVMRLARLSDKRVSELFHQLSQEPDVDEWALRRLTAELERRDQAAAGQAALDAVPDGDLSQLSDEQVMSMFAAVTAHHGAHPSIDRLTAELERRDAEQAHRAAQARQRELLTRPTEDMSETELDDLFRLASQVRDEQALQRVYDEWDRRRSAQQRRRRATHWRQSTPEQERHLDRLLAQGRDYLDAYAEVHDLDPEVLKAEQAAHAAGDAARAGQSRQDALRRQYDEWVHLQLLQAESATRGHLLSARGRAAGIDPVSLFSGPITRARAWASEELLRYWADNQRLTYSQFKQQLTGRGRQQRELAAAASAGRDFV